MVNRRTALLNGLCSALRISCCILMRALLEQLPPVLWSNWLAPSLVSISLLLKVL